MLVNDRYSHGGDIYQNQITLDFSVSINPLGTPEAVRAAVAMAANSLEAYPDPYCSKLREAIAESIGVKANHLLCGNGADELIYQFVAALRPKKALLPVPSFSDYESALKAAGVLPVFFPLLREEEFALSEAILEVIDEKTELLMLCSPNNPTGRCISRALLEKIVLRCRETNTWLFLDECFLDLAEETAAYSPIGLLREGDRVFLLRAFTKTYGMAGLRLGYAICKNHELIDSICRSCQPWNVSTPAQLAGIEALRCSSWAQNARAIFRAEKPYLISELQKLGFRTYPGDANFLLFSADPSLAQALLQKGILIRKCENYRDLSAGDFRIAVRTHEENEALIEAIREVTNA